MKFVSQAEFARLQGVDRSRIYQLKKAGRLVMAGKLVAVKASQRLIKATADPAHDPALRAPEMPRATPAQAEEFNHWRADRLDYQARIAVLKRAARRGVVMEV